MIEADAVEAVLERDDPLNLVGLIIAVSTSRIVRGGLPLATAVRESQSAVAKMAPRLSEGCPHSAASQVSLKSSQRIMVPMLKAA